MSLRRVIILLDRSSSMAGAPVGQAGAFVEWSLLSALKGNRHIYGNVLVSLIAFDTSAEWVAKDADIDSFVFPNAHELAAFGGATLGAATDLLAEEISRVGDSESDLIVLISDGHFLDDVVDVTDRFSALSSALRISLGVDAAFIQPLAYFENWTKGGRRAAGDVFRATPQDVENWLSLI
jgi:uncharacterized protein YegL